MHAQDIEDLMRQQQENRQRLKEANLNLLKRMHGDLTIGELDVLISSSTNELHGTTRPEMQATLRRINDLVRYRNLLKEKHQLH